jgi:hypothetical protein
MIALALALALGATDPCVGADELGRPLRICFAPGQGLELSAGGAVGDGQAAGAGLAAGFALRWRGDTFATSGRREWLRDMALLESRVRLHGSLADARTAELTLWSGLFLRRLAEPFLLVPAPKPIRLPFPFDVGMAIDAGSARWGSGLGGGTEALDVEPVRAALLLDVGRHFGGWMRRAAFGPEASWGVRFEEGVKPVQSIVPFSGGRVELRAESADGLTSATFSGRAGWRLQFPGEGGLFHDARLGAERILVAVNDVPLALYAEGSARGGAMEEELSASVGVRVGWFR